jgi:hypothetical protein
MAAAQSYPGFDRNEYPGDQQMASLRRTFAYSAYWLNTPPGLQGNSWVGRRTRMRELGYGFLLLWNGRPAAQLIHGAAALGKQDGEMAAFSARSEGFPANAIVFLDQEEGGRLTSEQAAYIGKWVRAVAASGFRPGVYASGIDVPDGRGPGGSGRTISTIRDLHARFPDVHLWVANDQCPPAPGCAATKLSPDASGSPAAEVWQYAQSPRRPQFAAQCRATYAQDGNCYAPGQPQSGVFLDLNTASSPDPSHGR